MRLFRLSPVPLGGRPQRSSHTPLWLQILSGLVPVIVVLLVRLDLWPVVEQKSPFLTLALAVLVSAWYGGRVPGLLATAAGALIAAYFFLDPPGFKISKPSEVVELIFFILMGFGITWLAERLKTARRTAENTARRNTEILESIKDGFVAIDRDGRFTYVNQAAETILGEPKADLIGKNPHDVFPEISEAKVEAVRQRAAMDQAAVHFEYCDPASGGWADVNAYPAADGGLSVYFRDITERKRNEQTLAQMATIVDSSEDAIMSADLNGTIRTWNAAAERIYGHPANEAIGRSIHMLVPPDRAVEEAWIQDKLARGESIEHFETIRLRKDGKSIHVSITISPIRDKSGAVVASSGIIRDITERKALEERLRQTAKLESLGVLAGGIAHDFNNLLVGILGNASLATELSPPVSPVQPLLEEVIKASERAATLTRQLLAYSGRGRFVIKPLDLSGLVREIASLVRTSVPRTVQLHLELADGLPPVTADEAQMQQLIMNLVINGAEAMGERPGAVTVTTGVEHIDDASSAGWEQEILPGEYVQLSVQDTGAGMDEATIGKIFDPFFTTKFTGRGLGLSAVLGIVRGHEGHIRVSSSPGRGSTFKVLLPASHERIPEHETFGRAEDFTGRGPILVVDDEEIVRRTAAIALERRGYTVMMASDGREAIELFRKLSDEIALVVLDLSMPVMSGEECLARLREIQPHVPVILSSGFSEAEAVSRFQSSGATGFLQKPYASSTLARMVQATTSALDHPIHHPV